MTAVTVRTALPVTTVRTPPAGPLPEPTLAYEALAERFGAGQVYLLESLAGPEDDCRTTVLGFDVVLTVTVKDGVLRLSGAAALIAHVRSALLLPADPPVVETLPADGLRLLRPDGLWEALRRVGDAFDAPGSGTDFGFGFLTFLGYDAVQYIEQIERQIHDDRGLPDVYLVLHTSLLRKDLRTGEIELLTHNSPIWSAPDPAEILALLEAARPTPRTGPGDTATSSDTAADGAPVSASGEVSDDMESVGYQERAEECLEHIAAGDIYQVQVGHEVSVVTDAEPLEVYRRLRRRNPSPYMYLADLDGHPVVGASPELFIRIRDGKLTMRPIAGTAPYRGDAAAEEAGRQLAEDPKEIAEHVMLVDLCRNDVGRISRTDTLDVPEMMSLERYSHVLHLVSTVEGEVEDEHDSWDVVAATFPAGTMTGAPKLRAMEVIESTETSRRGLYAGAIGLMDIGGHANLALCIRTLIGDGDGYQTRASAGIVADSRPESEWRETIAKMGATYWAVTGEELRA